MSKDLITRKEAMELMGINSPYFFGIARKIFKVKSEKMEVRNKVNYCLYDKKTILKLKVKWDNLRKERI